MEGAEFQSNLERLASSLQRMKALLAWSRLKQSEARPGQPPSFQIYDPTETDLRNEYSFFWFTSQRVQSLILAPKGSLSESTVDETRRALAQLHQEVQELNLDFRWRRLE